MSSNHKRLRLKSNHPHSPGSTDGQNGLKLDINPPTGVFLISEKTHQAINFQMRPCISIGGSVHPLVSRSVRRSIRKQLFSKLKNEGFLSCMISERPRNITEIGKYACWSVPLAMFKVEKRSKGRIY